MPITATDIAVLLALVRYYVLTRPQIQRLCFPDHKSGRSVRRRLSRLFHARFIGKHSLAVAFPSAAAAGPAYYLTAKGAELLATYFDDEAYFKLNTRSARADLLAHWIAISETHMVVEQAIGAQSDVKLQRWINEWEAIKKDASKSQQFTLLTVLRASPPLSCSPDAGFMLSLRGHKKVFYLEQDRGTDSPRRIAARKTPGYAELARRQLHRRHFPETTFADFSVLMVTTDLRRRDALRKNMHKKPGSELWLFASARDLRPETFLHESITVNCDGTAAPLVKSSRESLPVQSG